MEAPADVPNVNVLVTLIVDWKQPVPDPKVPLVVYVKLVVSAILNTVVPSVACARTILVAPKAIALVFVLLELKVPVVRVNPPRFKFPEVSVVVPVDVKVTADVSVVVPPLLLMTKPSNDVDPPLLTLPAAPIILTVSATYEAPIANVKLP